MRNLNEKVTTGTSKRKPKVLWMLTEIELKRIAEETATSVLFLEKDYVLTVFLLALALLPSLKRNFIFKGGGALRRAYFSQWRSPEQLDFTLEERPSNKELAKLIKKTCAKAEREFEVKIQMLESYAKQKTCRLRLAYTGPLRQRRVFPLVLYMGERLTLPAREREIITAPFPLKPQKILVLALEELLAEKLRDLLLAGEPTDFFDIWLILTQHAPLLDKEDLQRSLERKCQQSGFDLEGPQDFLAEDLLTPTRAYWQLKLGKQVACLPTFERAYADLKEILPTILAS